MSFKSGLYEKSLFYNLMIYGLFRQIQLHPLADNRHKDSSWVLFKNDQLFKVAISKESSYDYFSNKLSDSIVFGTLLKMAKCFSKMNNFKETYGCLEEAEAIESRNSYLYFLYAKTSGYTSLYNQIQIQKASNYLRKSKFLFTKDGFFQQNEKTLNKLKLN